MRRLACLFWVTLLVRCAWAGASVLPKATASPRPNIVVITLDTTRADRMGFLGSGRGLTPNLDTLARESVVFSRAYAQVPLTTPSHATIFTGTYPQFNHVTFMGDQLGKSLPFVPDILHKSGYRTGAFVAAPALDPKTLAPGFERGFDTYDAGFEVQRPGVDRYHSLERRGEEVVNHALAWLGKQPGAPFFVWVHLYDAHDPYDPPEPYKTRYKTQPYDGEIAYTDAAVAKLLSWLRTHGLFDNTMIAVMSDHGEAFGEHGERHHGIFLYDETIQVPLLIKVPRQKSEVKVATRVGLIDVAPTILQAAHLEVPAAMQGESLSSLMRADAADADAQGKESNSRHPVYAESDYGHQSFGWSKLQSWRTGKYLYIDAPERELYDQASDPQAAKNLASSSKAVADTAATQVAEFYQKTKGGAVAEATKLSLEQTENLHALGYMSADSGAPSDSANNGGPDPKARIGNFNLLYEALVDVEAQKYQEAVPILENVIKEEPNTPNAYLQLGRSYMALKEYDKAVIPLQKLVESRPDYSFGRYELGSALVKTGRWDDALPHFQVAVTQMTGSAMMHFYLAQVYQRTSRIPEAEKEAQNALQLDPNIFAANLLMGWLCIKQQKATEGLPYSRKAIELRPDSIDAHLVLSEVYRQLGQPDDAGREYAEVQRLRTQGGSHLGTPKDNPVGVANQR